MTVLCHHAQMDVCGVVMWWGGWGWYGWGGVGGDGWGGVGGGGIEI